MRATRELGDVLDRANRNGLALRLRRRSLEEAQRRALGRDGDERLRRVLQRHHRDATGLEEPSRSMMGGATTEAPPSAPGDLIVDRRHLGHARELGARGLRRLERVGVSGIAFERDLREPQRAAVRADIERGASGLCRDHSRPDAIALALDELREAIDGVLGVGERRQVAPERVVAVDRVAMRAPQPCLHGAGAIVGHVPERSAEVPERVGGAARVALIETQLRSRLEEGELRVWRLRPRRELVDPLRSRREVDALTSRARVRVELGIDVTELLVMAGELEQQRPTLRGRRTGSDPPLAERRSEPGVLRGVGHLLDHTA